MAAYYNEIDPYAAQWLRNLIAAGHIAAGDVDERSIEDVRPDDLRGYTQCHFFAGIGVWSYALRLAGWPDDRPVWTGSCPCQPFSAAGKGAGFADERHLWPAWAWLIGECRPPVIVGEQVASKDIDPWIDLVQADLEAMGYALGCVPFPSAGVGAPIPRERSYFLALECADRQRRERGKATAPRYVDDRSASVRTKSEHGPLISTSLSVFQGAQQKTNGFWSNADWLECKDEIFRAVEPGTFPLADGAASRVGRLRAYGNAINAEAAAEFIRAADEALTA